jgi:hypothetical protein
MNKAALMAGLPATPPPNVTVPNAAPETIVVSIWGGPPGPAGAPGAGVSLQGVAETWPPSDAPAAGDLYVVADPVPAGTPAGIAAGDGVVWNGDEWVSTGPIRGPAGETGPEGPEGPQGPGPSVFEGVDEPVDAVEGDLWLKPETDPDGDTVLVLNVFSGGAWKPVAGGVGGGEVTVDTTVTGPITGIAAAPDLPIQQWSEEVALKAAFKDTPVTFTRVRLQDKSGGQSAGDPVSGDGWVLADYGYFGTLNYGNQPGRAAVDGYVLPTPTQQGYLRADLDPASGWYFAEPVIVSDTAPPTPPGDPALPTLWIDPTGSGVPDPADGRLSDTNPLKYESPLVMEQASGTPIGLSADGQTFHQPDIVGAIRVLIDGKRYLLPVIEE